MEITLKDIAKRLNISTSTVSRALQDSHEVSEQTKQRVKAVAKELNFQPNPIASSLRRQKSKTVAVILPEISNAFFTQALKGAEDAAKVSGYHLLVYLTSEDPETEEEIISQLHSGRADGVLISVSGKGSSRDQLRSLQQKQLPIVFFDRTIEEISASKITTDDFNSAFSATEHLIQSGCRNIAFLLSDKNLSTNRLRAEGFSAALLKHGIKSGTTTECGNAYTESYKRISELLSSGNIDGIFCSTENLAIILYQVAAQLRITIPQKLKVISFSNLDIASLLSPPLTTVTQPAYEIGKQSAEILFKTIKQPHIDPEHVIIASSLIKRASTGNF